MAKIKYISEYKIDEKVHIKELDRPGRVIEIMIDSTGIEYLVRYFDECQLRKVYFLHDEIESIKS